MLSVYKDTQRNTWYVTTRYKNWNGESKQKVKRGFPTKKEASEWEREFRQKQKADMGMQFQSFVEIYFEDRKSRLKERSIRNKRYMINAKVIPYFGKMSINSIKPTHIMSWQNEIMEQGYSQTYLRMLQNQVTAIFNHAERFYGLTDNPCKKVEKMGRSYAAELEFWTKAEFEDFIKTFDEDEMMYKVLFEVLFWTGCRIGEALALTKADINFEMRTVSIVKTYFRHERKDVITRPKTENSIRTIAIPEFLCAELTDYCGCIYGLRENERIFGITDRAVQKKFHRKTDDAGMKRIRVHDLRHSHVALLIEKGVSPLAIAERVGHASINMTMDVYGHLYPDKQRQIADMLDGERSNQ